MLFVGVILHSSKKLWKRSGQQSHDPTIAVYCDGDEQAAEYAANGQTSHAASIAIYGQRQQTNVLMNGVYRITDQIVNEHPVYQMNDLYLSANNANQWVITHADGIGSTNGMAYIRNDAQLAIGDITVGVEPDRAFWQVKYRFYICPAMKVLPSIGYARSQTSSTGYLMRCQHSHT